MNFLKAMLALTPFRPQDNDTPERELNSNLTLIAEPHVSEIPRAHAVISHWNGKPNYIGVIQYMESVGECEAGWHAIQHSFIHCGIYQSPAEAANAVHIGFFG